MTQQTPTAPHPTLNDFDRYIAGLFADEDDALRAARAEMEREGLPKINVSANEGKVLFVLARSIGARRILEIGTLGGYSAIWLARALPEGGKLISCELDAHHADVARRNLDRAGFSGRVEVRVGPAIETLAALQAESQPPFDIAFIDADKDGYVDYLHATIPLVRTGGLILADNTLPDAIADPNGDTGAMRYNSAVSQMPGLATIVLPILRDKGIDGLTMSVKVG